MNYWKTETAQPMGKTKYLMHVNVCSKFEGFQSAQGNSAN